MERSCSPGPGLGLSIFLARQKPIQHPKVRNVMKELQDANSFVRGQSGQQFSGDERTTQAYMQWMSRGAATTLSLSPAPAHPPWRAMQVATTCAMPFYYKALLTEPSAARGCMEWWLRASTRVAHYWSCRKCSLRLAAQRQGG